MAERIPKIFVEPPEGYLEVPSLPLCVDQWKEDLEYLIRYSGGKMSSAQREEDAQRLRSYYGEHSPLREFVGFAFVEEDAETVGMRNVERVWVRVMARSGFEGRKAVIQLLGDEYGVSLANWEDSSSKRRSTGDGAHLPLSTDASHDPRLTRRRATGGPD